MSLHIYKDAAPMGLGIMLNQLLQSYRPCGANDIEDIPLPFQLFNTSTFQPFNTSYRDLAYRMTRIYFPYPLRLYRHSQNI